MSACRQCGKEVGPLRTKAGLYRRGTDISIMDPKGLFCTMRCAARYGVVQGREGEETPMNRQDFPLGPLGDRAWEIAQSNGGYGLQALADAADECERVGFCIVNPSLTLFDKILALKGIRARVFVAIHRCFTWRPRLCRYSVGWSLWWLWFEVAKIGEQP